MAVGLVAFGALGGLQACLLIPASELVLGGVWQLFPALDPTVGVELLARSPVGCEAGSGGSLNGSDCDNDSGLGFATVLGCFCLTSLATVTVMALPGSARDKPRAKLRELSRSI